jgi:hypothetical protein
MAATDSPLKRLVTTELRQRGYWLSDALVIQVQQKNIYHVNHPSGAKPTIFVGSVGFAPLGWFTKKLNLMALGCKLRLAQN